MLDETARPSRSGILFIAGKDNIVENSLIEKHDSGNERASSDVMIDSGEFIIHGKIVNTRMLSERTIIFGYPAYSSTHLDVVNYDAPNDDHGSGSMPKSFTLWRIDNNDVRGSVDTYFVAKVEGNS